MKSFPAAGLIMPLVLSALLAIACIAAGGWAMPPPQEDVVVTLGQRLFDNPFVVLIGVVGLCAFIFGLLQLWAFQSGGQGLMARLAGHSGASLDVVAASEPGLTASLYSERWDHLAAIRMAPLSYAIWVLPLLGFIGTVIGISDAIGDLGSVFADSNREEALASVLSALQFAFDTTFAGLVLVIPVMALATTVSLQSDAARDAALAENFGTGTVG
jgi:hypothetical protein